MDYLDKINRMQNLNLYLYQSDLRNGPLFARGCYKHTKNNSKALDQVVSDKKIFFFVFPIQAYVKHVTHRTGPLLALGT